MNIIESFLTKNPCYQQGRKIEVKGLMIHSVGCPQPNAKAFVSYWNDPNFNSACVHAFIDGYTGDVYQTLPWNHRGWHAGGQANNTHIGVEMCEPSSIKYVGGATWTELGDGVITRETVMRTYKSAVELFAYLCKQYDLNPLADGVIISHSEGYKRGVASNHADVEHLWKVHGLTMDGFRKEIKAELDKLNTPEVVVKPESQKIYKVQLGAFSVKENAERLLKNVQAAGFDAFITKVDGWYKVQAGAFSIKENADNMLAKLRAKGFDGVIVVVDANTQSTPVKPVIKEIKVGDSVKIIGKAKTYDGKSLLSFCYGRTYKVSNISGDKVGITFLGIPIATMKKTDLELV